MKFFDAKDYALLLALSRTGFRNEVNLFDDA